MSCSIGNIRVNKSLNSRNLWQHSVSIFTYHWVKLFDYSKKTLMCKNIILKLADVFFKIINYKKNNN